MNFSRSPAFAQKLAKTVTRDAGRLLPDASITEVRFSAVGSTPASAQMSAASDAVNSFFSLAERSLNDMLCLQTRAIAPCAAGQQRVAERTHRAEAGAPASPVQCNTWSPFLKGCQGGALAPRDPHSSFKT